MATQYTAGLTTGQVLTSATMNSIGAAWESYTPTLTNYTASTILSKYTRLNKLVIWQVTTLVSTGSAGEISLTLPVTAFTTIGFVGARNFGMWYDASLADSYMLAMFLPTTTTVKFFLANSTTPGVLNGSALAVSDELSFVLIYEAA
jgi:hypothetical protein